MNSYAKVERSIIFDEVDLGRHAQNAIIDKGVRVPPNAKVGFDLEADKARGFTVTESGIVVVPSGYRFECAARSTPVQALGAFLQRGCVLSPV